MKKTGILITLLLILFVSRAAIASSDTTPSPFSLTYYELYGTPIEPLSYANNVTDALGFDVLAEYNPSYYASLGLNYEKTSFYDGFNSTASFLGIDVRFFAAPNGKSSFAPYVYGGAGMGLSTGTGNQLKAGLGSRLQLFYPMFLDFSAGSNWIDSGLQYLTFKGGLSISFDLPKGEDAPTAKPTVSLTVSVITSVTPTITATPVNTLMDILATPSVTATPTNTVTVLVTSTITSTPTATITATITKTPVLTPLSPESKVKACYRAGMKAVGAHRYLTAITQFKKALAIKDPKVQYYFYAESNAMLGVIYQFDSKVNGHNDLAVKYYKQALKIDPQTKSAKKYLKMLQSQKPAVKKPEVNDDAPVAEAPKPTVEVKATVGDDQN